MCCAWYNVYRQVLSAKNEAYTLPPFPPSLPPSSPSLPSLPPPGHSRERRDTDKRLREEQDIAFQTSLEADKAKKREREQQLVFTLYLVHPHTKLYVHLRTLVNCMYIHLFCFRTLVSQSLLPCGLYCTFLGEKSFGPTIPRLLDSQ